MDMDVGMDVSLSMDVSMDLYSCIFPAPSILEFLVQSHLSNPSFFYFSLVFLICYNKAISQATRGEIDSMLLKTLNSNFLLWNFSKEKLCTVGLFAMLSGHLQI
jgi:hypothetical protein